MKKPKKEGLSEEMERAISDAIGVLNKIRQKYPEHYPRPDLNKIALSLFIQRRGEA